MKLDSLDLKILELLQQDAEQQVAQIAAQVGLSTTPCWRRIQRLKEAGVITRQVALLDARKINVGVTVFVSVRTSIHSQEWFERFRATIQAIPEVVEFYRMSGDVDYLLRVVVPDIAAYDAVYKRLIAGTELHDVSSSFAMEELKLTTALPLSYVK
ncbi:MULTISPECIES: Lrp/AsnC family transcriptional regulator [Roseateles]|uniref:Lrp/AsnC family transcriptional regulator n=1 Tax=Roseateles TaxID=93681 RepID=UPI0010F6C300